MGDEHKDCDATVDAINAELAAERATFATLRAALEEISAELPCQTPCKPGPSGCVHCGHQTERWCAGCVARAALSATNPGERAPWRDAGDGLHRIQSPIVLTDDPARPTAPAREAPICGVIIGQDPTTDTLGLCTRTTPCPEHPTKLVARISLGAAEPVEQEGAWVRCVACGTNNETCAILEETCCPDCNHPTHDARPSPKDGTP